MKEAAPKPPEVQPSEGKRAGHDAGIDPAHSSSRSAARLQLQPATPSPSNDRLEREADNAAESAVAGEPVETLSAVPPSTGTTLVEDGTEPAAGQIRKSAFLDALEPRLCAVLDQELEGGSAGCPDLRYYLGIYRGRGADEIDRGIHLWASPQDSSVGTMLAAVANRVRDAARRYRATGRVEGVPSGGLTAAVVGVGALQLKGAGAPEAQAPGPIAARLGGGRPLDAAVRAQLERSFGQSFAEVRVHDDAHAGSLAEELDARAFTIGTDVGFAAGEYQPDTLAGRALLAHELAHVQQQRGGGGPAGTAHEREAELAALGSLTAGRASVRRRSGLALQRCTKEKPLAERLGALTDARQVASALRDLSDADLTAAASAPADTLLGDGVRWEQAFRRSDWHALRTLAEGDRRDFWKEYGSRIVDRITSGQTTIRITGDPTFGSWVERQFMALVQYRTGVRLVLELLETGQPVELQSGTTYDTRRQFTEAAPDVGRLVASGESGPLPRAQQHAGAPTGSAVTLAPGAPQQVTLGRVGGVLQVIDADETMGFGHELIHALHNARGENIAPTLSTGILRGLGGLNLVNAPATGEAESREEMRTITGQTSFTPPTGFRGQATWPLDYNLPPGITENDLRREAGLPERVSHSGGVRDVSVPVRAGETLDQLVARYSRTDGRPVQAALQTGLRAVINSWYPDLFAGGGLPASISQIGGRLRLPTGSYMSLYFLAQRNQELAEDAGKLQVR